MLLTNRGICTATFHKEKIVGLNNVLSQADTSSSSGKSLGYLKREEIIGKPVVGTDAIVLGTVRDVAVSLDGKAALQLDGKVGGDAGGEVYIGSDEIQALGDVVLLNHSSRKPALTPSAQAPQNVVAPMPVSQSTPVPTTPTTVPPPPPMYSSNVPGPSGRMCPRCGYTNAAAAKFCIKCGSPMT